MTVECIGHTQLGHIISGCWPEWPIFLSVVTHTVPQVAKVQAMASVWQSAGNPLPVPAISWPHSQFSCTHAVDHTVVAYSPHPQLAGLGIDLEHHTPGPKSEPLFLTPAEQEWLATFSPQTQASLRRQLWTLKEAVFKANKHQSPRMLNRYAIDLASYSSGTHLYVRHQDRVWEACCLETPHGSLSLAWCIPQATPS